MKLGKLDSPTDLGIDYHNKTHDVVTWTPPYTLVLTAEIDSIITYSVTMEIEHPPPRYPYNPSVSSDLPPSTSTWTRNLSGDSPRSFIPRYLFPLWLSVTAVNPVGPGYPSSPFRYIPSISTVNCTRLKGGIVWVLVVIWCQKYYCRCGVRRGEHKGGIHWLVMYSIDKYTTVWRF